MEEHLKWLEKVIENPDRQLFILEVDGMSVGQLRLDAEKVYQSEEESIKKGTVTDTETLNDKYGLTAEISYGLGAEFRGKGLGKVLLEQAETLAEMFKIRELKAEVLSHNIASQQLFEKLGYIKEQKGDLYVYRKRYE